MSTLRSAVSIIAAAPRADLSLEFLGRMQHQSSWQDVVAKAKRLIGSGQVTVIHNGPNYVQGHVVGDHGEYDCEISRTDPQSSVIEQWTCECPWDQFAFNRTRKWKKLEGRVCSHVLALYWKGKSTPLDSGSFDPTDPSSFAPFQNIQQPPPPVSEEQADSGQLPTDLPQTFMPDGTMVGPDGQAVMDINQQRQDAYQRSQGQPVPDPNQQLKQGPANPFSTPRMQGPRQPQRDHLQLFDVTTPPGFMPVPPVNPVSIPGGKPPTPANPVQFPGTFSHFLPVVSVATDSFHFGSDQEEFEALVSNALRMNQRLVFQLRRPVVLEQSGGKIPMPGAEPIGTTDEGIQQYRTLDLGWDPNAGMRVRADDPAYPNGAPPNEGVYSEVAAGRRGEITDIEPAMKMVHVHIPLNQSGPLHPHLMVGWLDYDDIVLLPDRSRSPFWKRR